jgi:membrane protein YqaA with SNARE-associated domain
MEPVTARRGGSQVARGLRPGAEVGEAGERRCPHSFPLIVAFVVTGIINVVPAFMPPSWSVLAFFLIQYHLPLLVVTIGGAVASSVGRWLLALGARRWGPKFLSQRRRRGLRQLGTWIDQKPTWAIPVVVMLFALGPVPSNAVFLAAGLTGIRLVPVVAGFFVGRAISYTVLDLLSQKAAGDFKNIFLGGLTDPKTIIVDLAMLGAVVAFAFVDWPKLLHLPDPEGEDASSQALSGGSGHSVSHARTRKEPAQPAR